MASLRFVSKRLAAIGALALLAGGTMGLRLTSERHTTDDAVARAAARLRDPNRSAFERLAAARELESLGPAARSAVPVLIELLNAASEPEGRLDEAEIAAFALARIAPDPAVEHAVPVLIATIEGEHGGWTARFHAAVALLKLGRADPRARAIVRDETHLSLMLPLLERGEPLDRLAVCEALQVFGPPRRDLLDLLRRTAAEDPEVSVRAAAATALREARASTVVEPANGAPRALPSLPPELAEAAEGAMAVNRALAEGDLATFRRSLPAAAHMDFDRAPGANFEAYRLARLSDLQLLGGRRKGGSVELDYLARSGAAYVTGTLHMVREGGQWLTLSTSTAAAGEVPSLGEPPRERNEQGAIAALRSIAAAQMEHWDRSSPSTYAASLNSLPSVDTQTAAGRKSGYLFSLRAGGEANGVFHAWFAEAHPVRYGETGVGSYAIDDRGILIHADTRGRALELELPRR